MGHHPISMNIMDRVTPGDKYLLSNLSAVSDYLAKDATIMQDLEPKLFEPFVTGYLNGPQPREAGTETAFEHGATVRRSVPPLTFHQDRPEVGQVSQLPAFLYSC